MNSAIPSVSGHRVSYVDALRLAVVKLDPRRLRRQPVLFVVEIGAVLATILGGGALVEGHGAAFAFSVAIWLWLTVLFGTFAEAMAEGRGRAQASALRGARADVPANRVRDGVVDVVSASTLVVGDVVRVAAGEVIPGDGEVIVGAATVDESAITGESAPVIREAGGDRSAVTGGTRVLSEQLDVRITAGRGESFLDRMISMVEGSARHKTPNELALDILLAALTVVFLLVVVTLRPQARLAGLDGAIDSVTLVALVVCLIPTTIGGLISAIGIAGMDRLVQRGVIATSGRAVEAAGDVSVLLLDKTGTITVGARQATELIPAPGVDPGALAQAALLASLFDETPEGRSIVLLARAAGASIDEASADAAPVPFSASTRVSGIDIGSRRLRKGARDAIATIVAAGGGDFPRVVSEAANTVAKDGATPLVVIDDGRVLGVIRLKDIVKEGIAVRFRELRALGIRTVMITGDNPLTAAAIAAEAGVDDFIAEATPEQKLARIRSEQAKGHLVAMTGDGTNDAPALAQADVAVAMNTGTQAAKEAANMVDLDSSPTKLIDIVTTGKELLVTRGALTTFSIANDVSKYFAIIPATFAAVSPQFGALNVMGLSSPQSAVLSAVIFNALIIVALVPLALRGVAVRAMSAQAMLRRHMLIFGLGGLVLPFPCIKAIDVVVAGLMSLVSGSPHV